MIGDTKVCSICSSEVSIKGCLRDGNIILLGKQCLGEQIKESDRDYNLVDLELALRMKADSSLLKLYLKELTKIDKAIRFLKNSSYKVTKLKKKLKDGELELISSIKEIFTQKSTEIKDMYKEIQAKIQCLLEYKNSLSQEGRLLIDKYQAQGSKSLIDNKIKRVDIPIDEIVEYIRNSITLQYSRHTHLSLYNIPAISDRNRDSILYELRKEITDMSMSQRNSESIRMIERLSKEINELKSNEYSLHFQILQLKEALNESKLEPSTIREDYEERVDKPSRKKSLISKSLDRSANSIQKLKADHSSVLSFPLKSRRYIYVPKRYSKSMIEYDITCGQACLIDLHTLDTYFIDISSCELPNGDIFMVGLNEYENVEVYLYKIATRECITLPSLPYPRNRLALYYYKHYVYAFGGKDSNRADRYSLYTNMWETLPKMKYQRCYLSCVGIKDNICLFYGKRRNIEIFSITDLQFYTFELDNSDTIASDYGVACRVNDRVYLVTDNLIQVYDTSLKKLKEYSNIYPYRHYSLDNIVHYDKSIYYYDHYKYTFQKINTYRSSPQNQLDYNTNNRYIYITKNDTKVIHRISLNSYTTEFIDLSSSLDRYFNATSICLLENGQVFIAGFNNPVSSECYLYSPSYNTCTKMPNSLIARYNTSLICHDKYLYAFGGRDNTKNTISRAERIHTSFKNSWTLLPDMVHSRALASCVCIDNKIYIIGGGSCTIEIYNIITNNYSLSKVHLYTEYVVSVTIDDKIHIAGGGYYKILAKDLQVLLDVQDMSKDHYSNYTISNSVYYEGYIYFFNHESMILEKVHTASCEREIQITTRLLTYSSNNIL